MFLFDSFKRCLTAFRAKVPLVLESTAQILGACVCKKFKFLASLFNPVFFHRLRVLMRALALLGFYLFPPTFLYCLVKQLLVAQNIVLEGNQAVVMFINMGYVISLLHICNHYHKRGVSVYDAVGFVPDVLTKTEKFQTVVAGFLLGAFASTVLNVLPPSWLNEYDAVSAAQFKGQSKIIPIAIVLFFAPFTEEFIFRGVIAQILKRAFMPHQVVVITALLFGVMHSQPIWIVYSTLFGLLFGYLNFKKKSLCPSLLMHFGVNLSALPGMLLAGFELNFLMITRVLLIIVGIILAYIAFSMLNRMYMRGCESV